MTQEERWMVMYNSYKPTIGTLLDIGLKSIICSTTLKANRKQLNAGKLKEDRVKSFKVLLAVCEEYKRKNQSQ